MLTDIQIAQGAKMDNIVDVAKNIGITADDLELYGKYKAKISNSVYSKLEDKPDGKLVLVTAINPTPAGEGKTTTTIGIGQAMKHLGKNCIIAIREPSLGPVFGIKGGAAGGGYSQVVPMEDINLHFTGDMHAITTANNLLCAAIDNHIHQGNVLRIDQRRITFKRCLDMNDRALRNVTVALGGKVNGFPREDGFQISVASEVMAVLCLADDIHDLKKRLGEIIIGYNLDGEPVCAKELKVHGAMAAVMKDAVKPNLVQTLENTPALMHGGPFANIAHGCNSVKATKLAMKLADYTITEAGFGSDLGAEKFMDIKCRAANIAPNAIVIVATVRALKYNGGVPKAELNGKNLDALSKGIVNLKAHIENMKKFGVPVMVAINEFPTDTKEELDFIANFCKENGAEFASSAVFSKGGEGGTELAEKVIELCERKTNFSPLYDLNLSIKEKIETIAKSIYGADGVDYSKKANNAIRDIEKWGFGNFPVCIAKTQYSLSDDPTLLGRPSGFRISVSEVTVSAGAGFIVVKTGDVMTMPGLPKVPAANTIDIDENGNIVGLF